MASVDVVLPCFQYGRFLRDCVASILRQNIRDIRILIIDNASTDNSAEVAQELTSEDKRIEIVVHSTNLGSNASYNEGIDWAASDYFIILDADDILAEGCIERGVSVMELDPAIAFCYGCELQAAFPSGRPPLLDLEASSVAWNIVTGSEFIERTCRYPVNTAANSSLIVRTSAQKKAGYYNARLPHSDDLEMLLRLAVIGSVASTKAVHAIRRIHSQQKTQHYASSGHLLDFVERRAAFDSFFENTNPSMAGADQLRAQAHRSLSAKAYWSALSHMAKGHPSDAMALMKFSLQCCPSMAVIPPVDWLFRMEDPLGRIRAAMGNKDNN